MNFINVKSESLPTLVLNRDVTKHLKQGHRWIFASSFENQKTPTSGLSILQYKKDLLAVGVVQPETQLRFRLFFLIEDVLYRKNNLQKTLDDWLMNQWRKAVRLRAHFNLEVTNSFRLINGEGDGLPGLIVDIYHSTAVIKFDNALMESIWNSTALAELIQITLPQIKTVYLKRKNAEEHKGECLIGELPQEIQFKENNLIFSSNIRDAAKTGFFLDQRDNRLIISRFSKDLEVLNLFSYTGGFSLFAALGGARKVTSVDIAKAAIENVKRNFELNHFKIEHIDLAADAFKFVENEILAKNKYGMVITDPPSFAPNEKSVPQATEAYIRIFSDSLKLVEKNGFFAASSCSSHIDSAAFLEITKEAFSKARKKGSLVYWGAQPTDHPYPLAMTELRYLKFALFRVDD